ncbi:MAG: hypothetical protein KME16_14680 [Scytolyngbya sp. HA4215-MV1]|nr:hypothetical protein [Scytolyngbya sp. HA4215-MV1]
MNLTRFLRRTRRIHRSHLAIVVLPNEAAAFQTYRLLQYHGISPEHLAIVGEGYSSPERVGLLEPMQIAVSKARRLSIFAGSLGSAVGMVMILLMHWHTGGVLSFTAFLAVLAIGIVSGFLGAVIGALFGFLGEGSTAGIYRHHLRRGHYLLMMEGPETLVRWGQEVLNYYSATKAY